MPDKHFTYNEAVDKHELRQGDILKITEDLRAHLEKYHSYYATSLDYTHFQVLTQSCDLVPRGKDKACTSRYITLAAIRSLDTVIKRAVDKYADKKIEFGDNICCSDKHQDKLSAVLSSLFNNHEKDYFFLKASPEDGLINDSCTFLHLSIALKAHENYNLCLEAKILELKENFRAKLGWMVGNLYSRVGTEDYVPTAEPNQAAFEQLILKNLEKHVVWVPHDSFGEFKEACRESSESGITLEEIIEKAKEKKEALWEFAWNASY